MLPKFDRSGYFSKDTIAAIATGLGGAIAIVRVSGSLTMETLTRLTGKKKFVPRKMTKTVVYSESKTRLDDALVVYFSALSSYTGESLAEIHIHGNSYIATRLMESLIFYGARQALPGEFSFRAVRNGKMNLFQAQAVKDLIEASNDKAVDLALEKMGGTQATSSLETLSSQLKEIAALGELGIDFSDQDIDEVSLNTLKKKLSTPLELLKYLERSYEQGLKIQEGIKIVFAGLPNAGKSSLFNAILNENRSIVSEHAGTTRDVIREKLTLRDESKRSFTFIIEDTAGLRKSVDSIEKMGINKTYESIKKADLTLLIIDIATPEDQVTKFLKVFSAQRIPPEKIQIVITKSDQMHTLFSQGIMNLLNSLSSSKPITTSCFKGEGISELIKKMLSFAEISTKKPGKEILLTRIDHKRAVTECIEHLERSQTVVHLDLFASDLRQALNALSPLIGETLNDSLLEKIFSDFCIGK